LLPRVGVVGDIRRCGIAGAVVRVHCDGEARPRHNDLVQAVADDGEQQHEGTEDQKITTSDSPS
jgi:hypothetical protein